MTEGVPGTPFPTSAELATDPATGWRLYGVRESGQREKANGLTSGAVRIVRKCEERDAASVKAITRPWWKFWG